MYIHPSRYTEITTAKTVIKVQEPSGNYWPLLKTYFKTEVTMYMYSHILFGSSPSCHYSTIT